VVANFLISDIMHVAAAETGNLGVVNMWGVVVWTIVPDKMALQSNRLRLTSASKGLRNLISAVMCQ
jgi:hypothetical protein